MLVQQDNNLQMDAKLNGSQRQNWIYILQHSHSRWIKYLYVKKHTRQGKGTGKLLHLIGLSRALTTVQIQM